MCVGARAVVRGWATDEGLRVCGLRSGVPGRTSAGDVERSIAQLVSQRHTALRTAHDTTRRLAPTPAVSMGARHTHGWGVLQDGLQGGQLLVLPGRTQQRAGYLGPSLLIGLEPVDGSDQQPDRVDVAPVDRPAQRTLPLDPDHTCEKKQKLVQCVSLVVSCAVVARTLLLASTRLMVGHANSSSTHWVDAPGSAAA